MKMEQRLIYSDTEYHILAAEQEFIVHPVAFGYLPCNAASLQCACNCLYQVEDYKLFLESLELGSCEALNLGGVRMEVHAQQHKFSDLPVSYNGAVLIGTNLVREYYLDSQAPAYFSYQKVIEILFDQGVLITTIDQSRAMLRIRRNIELGLRSLTKKRDIRCINRFMNSALVGDYKPFRFNYTRMKYIKEMKKEYSQSELAE